MGEKKEPTTGGDRRTASKKVAGKALTPFDIRAAAAIKALAKTLPAKAAGGSGGGVAARPSAGSGGGGAGGKAGANVAPFKGPATTEPKASKGSKKSSIKQQIRGIERLLKREGITAEAKEAHEAKLKEFQQATKDRERRDLEQKYSKKYHMVRFFEKKKVVRKLAQVKKEVEEGAEMEEGAKQALLTKQTQLEADLEYIVNFPRDQKYVSIFKTEDKASIEKMREIVKDRKAEQEAAQAGKKKSEGGMLASSDEEEAPEEEDDFFAAAESESEEEPPASKIYPTPKGAAAVKGSKGQDEEEEEGEEQPDVKRKRDKKLPDRNRKAKKVKTAA